MPRNVAIVLERDYSAALERLAFHTPVWMVDTPENRAAAEEAWLAAVEWPHIRVTLFRETDWETLLEQIAFIEKFDMVEVIGTSMTVPARAALDAYGLTRFEETPTGFKAYGVRRREPPL